MRYLIAFFLLIFYQIGFGQDQTTKKMHAYAKAVQVPSLFVHFDKNVYANNEMAYFTGYLLKVDPTDINKHHVLSVALVRNADSTVILQDKFVMQNGLSYGNIAMPDKILTGEYHFLAYTDRVINGNPEVLFKQNVTLKTALDPPFIADVKLLAEPKPNEKQKKVLISVNSPEGRFLTSPITISYKYGKQYAIATADQSGQLLLNLPVQDQLADPNLYVKIKYARDSSFITLPILPTKQKASVKFFPEGGNMISGLYSSVAWEALDQQKMPLRLKAFLYKNDQVVDTIETSIYGIGSFKIRPDENATYKVKLFHSSLSDSIYVLPKAQASGIAISVPEAVVGDTLRMVIRSSSYKQLRLRVHNFQSTFINIPVHLPTSTQNFKIILDDVPKGLASITITDTLDRPLAERIFFAHYGDKERLTITSDKESYQQREKINLKLNLTSLSSRGLVSVAAVQSSRLALKNFQDIVSFNYLNDELQQLPAQLNGNPIRDLRYLEQILLVKGWRRYKWQDINQVQEKLASLKRDSLFYSGVLIHKKKDTTINEIYTFGSPQVSFISLDSNRHFIVPLEILIQQPQTRLYLLLNDKDRRTVNSNYTIKINDPYVVMNQKLVKLFNAENPILPSVLQNNKELLLKSNEKVIRLKEVVIGGRDNPVVGNECGDYVCPYHILNCVNHVNYRGNSLPIVGRTYLKYSGRTETVVYKGCYVEPDESIFFKIKPIFLEKEFYKNDYKDPQEPAFFSTIYWNYGIFLTGDKETTIDFNASDITGKFRVVVQGILNDDVVFAEHYFEVKPVVQSNK